MTTCSSLVWRLSLLCFAVLAIGGLSINATATTLTCDFLTDAHGSIPPDLERPEISLQNHHAEVILGYGGHHSGNPRGFFHLKEIRSDCYEDLSRKVSLLITGAQSALLRIGPFIARCVQ
jgi:hypothetical protein